MATYDLTQTIPSKITTGDILNCPYSGTYKTLILPKGTYKFECWGAQGGYRSSSSYGGKGGYSTGTLNLIQKTTIYIYTGGSGNTGGTSGGFNGGGKRYNYVGGGGASDIRIGQDSLYARIIVAGGGGSDGNSSKGGGAGGGTNGQDTTVSYYGTGGYGGGESVSSPNTGGTSYFAGINATQPTSTSPTSQSETYNGFGWGGSGSYRSNGYGGAGGGGWFGGVGTYPDGSGDDDKGGGGGSGYVYTSSTASNYPSGCLLDSSMYLTDTNTITGNASMPSTSGSTETGHSDNGYVRITVIEASSGLPIKMKVNGEIVEASAGYVKVDGAWKEIQDIYYKNNNTWTN
jgi:hypothetical protein